MKPEPIAGESIESLLFKLLELDDRVRYRARIELSGRPTQEINAKPSAKELVETNRRSELAVDHFCLALLWLHQSHNVLSVALLEKVLTCKMPNARAAAVRVIAASHDRLPDGKALDLLRRAAADESPRVRLMALWAASFIPSPEAAEVVLIVNKQPTEKYLEFLSKEVMRTLQPLLDNAAK